MKLSVPFCGGSSSAAASPKASNKTKSRRRSKDGKKSGRGSSFSSTASSHECKSTVTTPRTVLLPSSPPRSRTGTTSRKPAPEPAVTREELEVALRRVVSSEEELAEMLAEADAGIVADAVAAAGDEGDLMEAFAVFDADGDGRISAEELHAVLASLGDDCCSVDDCRRMIGGVDVDVDGFVCFDEFSRMMMHGL
jgi:calcium-binding protein CML